MPIFQALGPGQVAAWCPACHSPPSAPQSCRLRCGRRTFLKSRPSCQWRGSPLKKRGFWLLVENGLKHFFLLLFLTSFYARRLGKRLENVLWDVLPHSSEPGTPEAVLW